MSIASRLDATPDGGNVFRDLIVENRASVACADKAYNNQRNRQWLACTGEVNSMQTKKLKGQPISDRHCFANANANGFGVRSKVAMNVRTIGLDQVKIKLGLINLACNMCRYLFHDRVGTLS